MAHVLLRKPLAVAGGRSLALHVIRCGWRAMTICSERPRRYGSVARIMINARNLCIANAINLGGVTRGRMRTGVAATILTGWP